MQEIMRRIAILASGSGTNAEKIIRHFSDSPDINVALILSNRPDAFVLERALKHDIPAFVFKRSDFSESDVVLNLLLERKIDLIVLAGFLWLVPDPIIRAFPNRIVNIHPALLPKYGGKGMYGQKVHQAVMDNKEAETGITIHYVNDKYDDGEIIFQKSFTIEREDTVETIESKIHSLEHEHFPIVIEGVVKGKSN